MWNRYAALALFCGVSVICRAAGQLSEPSSAPSVVLTPSTPPAQDRQPLDSLRAEVADIKKKVEKPPKDNWDKLAAVSNLISGVVVAILGFYATNVYNRRQKLSDERRKDQELRIAQVQTVEKFFPHLSSSEERTKSAALVAIAALGDEELAVKLAKSLAGPGATSALATIASTASAPVAAKAEAALRDIFSYLKSRVVRIYHEPSLATGFICADGQAVTMAYLINEGSSKAVRIKLPNDTVVNAVVRGIDKERNLALLSFPPSEAFDAPPPLSLSSPEPGEPVTAIIIDQGGTVTLRIGKVVGFIQSAGSTRVQTQVQLSVEPGAGGTPVVDKGGRLIGLVETRSTTDDLVTLVSAHDVFEFVDRFRST
ncbi:serine protease [Paraburkholderia sp. EG287A]|uniref:S1 family peptidase n=1 Tax=unclassified Paraburkholderia TaxID=2615204 RepID=UPI0034D2E6CA